MLAGKNQRASDAVFTAIICFMECGTGVTEEAPMTTVHTMYYHLTGCQTWYRTDGESSSNCSRKKK